ncbi:MAG: arginine--tRNA ligase [Coriobacteriales bacterium]
MRKQVEEIVVKALEGAVSAGELPLETIPDPGLERPRDKSNGDWATTVAMRCAKQAHMSPRAIADIVAKHLEGNELLSSVEVAGPGFINLRLSNAALQSVFAAVREQGGSFGSSTMGNGTKIDIEFISANPTGPMHLGHGRWAALGDAICRVLDFAGFDVTREFYINDAGNQMNVFAQSVSCRYQQVARLMGEGMTPAQACEHIIANTEEYRAQLPENCYAGAYVIDIAIKIIGEEGLKWLDASSEEREAAFMDMAYAAVLSHNKKVLEDFGLEFDVWFSERTLHAKGEDGESIISKTIKELDELGYIYEKDGATWFRTTDFGDDKDRVLVKADGTYTYFAPDIAYHKNKLDRGHERCVDLLGADHHGYIKRIQSVGHVFGHPGQPEVIIGQMVNLFRDGEAVRMSKRTGEMVTFEELIDEVGADATRYLMLSRSTDQTIDFDIAEAKRQDSSNPVYYVQYAHARICSILRKAAGHDGIHADEAAERLIPAGAELGVLTEEAELNLARKIDEFGELVESCARDLAPFRLTYYAQELAACFHQFYTRCHVLTDDAALTTARLCVCDATRRVLENALSLLGVSAPERM